MKGTHIFSLGVELASSEALRSCRFMAAAGVNGGPVGSIIASRCW